MSTNRGYQWSRCKAGSCTAIEHANKSSYVIVAADVGYTLLVRETATLTGGNWSAVNSEPTAVVTES